MHTIFSALLAIHVLSAGTFATPAMIDRQSITWGILGQDADLTIFTWDNAGCNSTQSANNGSVELHWGLMRQTWATTQSYMVSRRLRNTERLDWSAAAADPPGANKARLDDIVSGCEIYLQTTSPDPNGNGLFENICYTMDPAADVSRHARYQEPVQ